MWQAICNTTEIPPGEYRSFEVEDIPVLVFHLDDGFYALEDRCTHDDAELDGGLVENGCIKCPRHGACFDIKSGDAMSAPAYEATDAFPCRVTDSQVEIDIS